MLGIFTAVCAGVTGYVYVGYPLLAALLARLRPAQGPWPAHTPPISLVVSAYNEQDVIAEKLRNTLALDYPPGLLEIIVVTDGSDDATPQVAQQVCAGRSGVTVLHEAGRSGKAAAMLRGVAAATAELLVFSDANNLYEPDALRQIVMPFADARVGAVTGAKEVMAGAQEVSGGEKAYWRYESFIKRQESRLGCCTAVVGELLAVRRSLMPDFPPGLVNDDFFLAMQVARQGYQVAYMPTALSWEPPAESLEADAVRRRRITAGRWQTLAWWRRTLPLRRPLVVWQVVSHKYLRLLLPFAMAGAFIGSALDVATRAGQARGAWRRWLVFAGQLTFYGLPGVGGRSSSRPLRIATSLSRYIMRSNLASALGLAQYLRNRNTLHLWQRVKRADHLEKT